MDFVEKAKAIYERKAMTTNDNYTTKPIEGYPLLAMRYRVCAYCNGTQIATDDPESWLDGATHHCESCKNGYIESSATPIIKGTDVTVGDAVRLWVVEGKHLVAISYDDFGDVDPKDEGLKMLRQAIRYHIAQQDAEIERLTAERNTAITYGQSADAEIDAALREAQIIAKSLHEEFYPDNAEWQVSDDLVTVILQISNAVSGIKGSQSLTRQLRNALKYTVNNYTSAPYTEPVREQEMARNAAYADWMERVTGILKEADAILNHIADTNKKVEHDELLEALKPRGEQTMKNPVDELIEEILAKRDSIPDKLTNQLCERSGYADSAFIVESHRPALEAGMRGELRFMYDYESRQYLLVGDKQTHLPSEWNDGKIRMSGIELAEPNCYARVSFWSTVQCQAFAESLGMTAVFEEDTND